MTLLSKGELLQRVLLAIEKSGWSANIIDREHPFKLLVLHDEVTVELHVHVWNVTPGGPGLRPPDEYRIQITGVDRIETGASFRTLLLGWDRRHKVFAGWNAARYETFGASPALQVKDGTLTRAQMNGMAIQPKAAHGRGNVTEVVVAFRPEMFGTYFSQLDKYHQPRLSRLEADLLGRVATDRPPTKEELESLSEERRHVIREVEQSVRNARFRKIVLRAYRSKCAICDLDLGIVHAAHIVPVEENGTDEPNNGIALCANHHAAFDKKILIIKDDYSVSVNPKMLSSTSPSELRKIGSLRRLRLPTNPRLKPKAEYLRLRMQIFGISEPAQRGES